jgi:hypothetical protein
MAAAPLEASVQVKTSTSSTGSAALITSSVVRNYRFQGNFKGPIKDWVEDNAKALLENRRDIGTQGLWTVMGAWVTDECAIKMTSGESQEIDVSFDLGATGIGKLGAGAGAFDKLKREGWWTYPKNEVLTGSSSKIDYRILMIRRKARATSFRLRELNTRFGLSTR